jgi:hypothetical protein
MKSWIKSLLNGLLMGLIILGSLPALADPYGVDIGHRALDQERRIQEGVLSGQLTPGEFQLLEREQARFRATEARMWADGHLSRGERARLNRMQARNSRDIYDLKHNRQRVAP